MVPQVFVSYSHRDAVYRDELLTTLAQLRRDGLKVWADNAITAGTEWAPEIWRAFDASQIILCLVSNSSR